MTQRKKRIPQLKHTDTRSIGWHVSYRDPVTGTPRKHRFRVKTRSEALPLYEAWVADWLGRQGDGPRRAGRQTKRVSSPPRAATESVAVEAVPGSLLLVGSDLIKLWEGQAREPGAPRRKGTIDHRTYSGRKKHVNDFLAFLNERHGAGAVARMRLEALEMEDVEAYNRAYAAERSESDVIKRMQVVKLLIDRAGRKEHGHQVLGWNWDSRDVEYGRASTPRQLPTLRQLKRLLAETDERGRTLIWTAIGLGFGATDLSAMEPRCIDETSYDLRRSKTSVSRYGDTPPLVWKLISQHIATHRRKSNQPIFLTRNGLTLVHGRTDSVRLWWDKLREAIGESNQSLDGFYVLRHLGATEYGSRDGCSTGAMKLWLGHGASSSMIDRYMRPVGPEHRRLIGWVRGALTSGNYDLKLQRGD
jgi:hypothetical protein